MRLNKPVNSVSRIRNHLDAVKNHEGGLAFKLSPKERLFQRVLTCFFGEPNFYKNVVESVDEQGNTVANISENEDSQIIRDIAQVAKEDPEFILKLAAYARNEMYLRTIPQVLLVESSNLKEFKGTGFLKPAVPSIVRRADEITEVLAYQLGRFGKPIPNALIRGLKNAFGRFDEYQFAKYNRAGTVKLKDAIRLVHPRPENKEREKLYKKIIEGNLEAPQTWEVEISTKGSSKESWEAIAPKMGYMALLRNLRNFLEKGCNIKPILERLTNEETVKKSKQFPFRFFSAYREIEMVKSADTTKTLDAIQDALELSCNNLPAFPGTTFMSADNSGSMDAPVSSRSKVMLKDIANLMQAISVKICERPITSVFGEDFKVVNLSSRSSIIDNLYKAAKTHVGYSTNGYKAIKYLLDNRIKVDRIMIFTDEQLYNSEDNFYGHQFAPLFKEYKNKINRDVYLYVVNLKGYGTTIVPRDEPRVALISGWSEKILNFVELFEKSSKTMVEEIGKYNIGVKKVVKKAIKKSLRKPVKKKPKRKPKK